jgi:hypothetical protein
MSEVLSGAKTTNPGSASAINEQDAALELVLADGNINLTAERLKITPPQLISLLSETDLARLNMQIKAVVAIRSFSLLNKLQIALETALADLEPKEMAKAYTALLSTLPNLLPSNQQQVRPPTIKDILSALPPEVQEAMTDLITHDGS